MAVFDEDYYAGSPAVTKHSYGKGMATGRKLEEGTAVLEGNGVWMLRAC